MVAIDGNKPKQWFEFAAVYLLVMAPIAPVLFLVKGSHIGPLPPLAQVVNSCVSPITAIVVILYLVLTGTGDRTQFGWRRPRPLDLGLASLLFFAKLLAYPLLHTLFSAGEGPATPSWFVSHDNWAQQGPIAITLLLLSVPLRVVRDELFFRGFVISRLNQILGIPALSIAVSSISFGLAQYPRTLDAFVINTAYGLLSAMAFQFAKSLWAPGIVGFVLRMYSALTLLR